MGRVASVTFRFETSLILEEATGLRAATLPQLSQLLREVPPSCIHHHTHDFLLLHQYLTPQPMHDFAYWVTEVLGEVRLGELLASIDPMGYATLEELRAALIGGIDKYLAAHPMAAMKFVSEGEEFFFVKSIHVILPTPYTARTLEEFDRALEAVSIHSLYYHLFDARLRLQRPTNDFSVWAAEQLDLPDLADELAAIDPYSQTLEEIRRRLRESLRSHLQPAEAPHG